MNIGPMALGIISGSYSMYTVFLSMKENASGIQCKLGIDKNHKEMEVQGRTALRGPHMSRKISELLSRTSGCSVKVEYDYIDSMPSPEQYASNLGLEGHDYWSLVGALSSLKFVD